MSFSATSPIKPPPITLAEFTKLLNVTNKDVIAPVDVPEQNVAARIAAAMSKARVT